MQNFNAITDVDFFTLPVLMEELVVVEAEPRVYAEQHVLVLESRLKQLPSLTHLEVMSHPPLIALLLVIDDDRRFIETFVITGSTISSVFTRWDRKAVEVDLRDHFFSSKVFMSLPYSMSPIFS